MINNLKKYGKYIGAMAGVLAIAILPAGCNSKDDIAVPTVSYGPEIGFADGNVDLSGDTPVIDISDIKSPVGENIDFLSGVTIANEEAFADLEVWVDASLVDIFTPGNYTVTYTFNYDGKSVSKDITVTIFEPETEQSASEIAGNNTNNSSGNNSQKPSNDSGNSGTTIQQGSSSNTAPPASTPGSSGNKTTTPNVSSENKTTTSGGSSGNNATTPANPTTTSQNPTTPQATSSTREIITTIGNSTSESKNIGNYTIELLSGKTITIKNTTSKYIVSTRTDVTTITRNDKTYRVSKLIITYNTGAEQVLETLEERIK